MPPGSATHTIRALIVTALHQVRRRWRGLLVLQAGFKLLSILLLAPLAAGLANLLVARGGAAAVGNLEIVGFVLSIPGLLALVLLPTVALSIFYLEQSTTLALMSDPPAGRTRRGLLEALRLTGRRLPSLAGVALVQVITAIFVAIPFLGLAGLAYWLLLGDADINYYLYARPPRLYVALAVGGLIGLGLLGVIAWFYMRWFFALPLALVEGHGPRAALGVSSELTHGRRAFVLRAVVTWLALRWLVFFLLAAGLAALTGLVLSWTEGRLSLAIWAAGALILFNTGTLATASAFDRVVYATLLKQLYRAARWFATPETTQHIEEHAEEARPWSARRAILVTAGMAVVVFMAVGFAASSAAELTRRQEVSITAHRAGPLLGPENSLSAMEAAIAAGADWIEIDAQLSADGTIWVAHDRDLLRVGGSPLVVTRARDSQLRQVRIGRGYGPEFADEPLPTLAQFLEAARGRTKLSIELKYYGFDPRLAPAVIELVREMEMMDQVNIISLEYEGLVQVRRLAPEIPLGYLVTARIGDITRLDVEFLSIGKTMLTQPLRARAAARGLGIAVWTTNDYDEMLRLMARGADDLVTDNPAEARRAVEAFESLADVELILLRLREGLGR